MANKMKLSAGSPKHSETHPTKNLINKLLSVPFYGGVAQLGERLNGIQEVKSSILSVSTKKTENSLFLLFSVFYFNPYFFRVLPQKFAAKKNLIKGVNDFITASGM